MKFKYKRYGPGILRPVIPIEITHKNLSVPYEVLVDSGADTCIFDAEIADILGLDITKGEKDMVAGVTGISETYYIHPITITVGDRKYKINAGFLRNIGRFGYGIVGQIGFFDTFIVTMDYKRGEIELEERRRSLKN